MKNWSWPIFILFGCLSGCGQKAPTPENQLRLAAQLFSNDNWQYVQGEDTIYVNFSAKEGVVDVYQFKMENGDSVQTKLRPITLHNQQLLWHFDHTTYLISLTDSTRMEGRLEAGTQPMVYWQKTSDSTIQMTLAGQPVLMKRTLPLATFLVRSKFDHDHQAHTLNLGVIPPRSISTASTP